MSLLLYSLQQVCRVLGMVLCLMGILLCCCYNLLDVTICPCKRAVFQKQGKKKGFDKRKKGLAVGLQREILCEEWLIIVQEDCIFVWYCNFFGYWCDCSVIVSTFMCYKKDKYMLDFGLW